MAINPFALLSSGRFTCTPKWLRQTPEAEHFHRLYFPISGHARLQRGSQRVALRAPTVYLIPSHQAVTYHCGRRMELDWLHFRLEGLEQDAVLSASERIIFWPAADWVYWQRTYRRMDELITQRPPSLVAEVQAMLMDKVGQVVVELREDRRRFDPYGVIEQLRPAIAFMDGQFVDNPPLERVAQTVHLSPTHFHRLFRNSFGLTPRAYMLRKRMAMAAALLQSGRWRVSEVAARCGYPNLFYFSRVYKQYHGHTAQQARSGSPANEP